MKLRNLRPSVLWAKLRHKHASKKHPRQVAQAAVASDTFVRAAATPTAEPAVVTPPLAPPAPRPEPSPSATPAAPNVEPAAAGPEGTYRPFEEFAEGLVNLASCSEVAEAMQRLRDKNPRSPYVSVDLGHDVVLSARFGLLLATHAGLAQQNTRVIRTGAWIKPAFPLFEPCKFESRKNEAMSAQQVLALEPLPEMEQFKIIMESHPTSKKLLLSPDGKEQGMLLNEANAIQTLLSRVMAAGTGNEGDSVESGTQPS